MSEEGWIRTQRKVFTRWVNAYLRQRSLEVDDLDKDFEDGVLLIHLLEILGKEAIPKWNRTPKMKIHKQENLKKAWDYMKARGVPLTNIGAEDVTNGNAKIILALVWALIVFFQLNAIALDGISGKKGLLLWCQRLTQGYAGVEVKDFAKSWADGRAFCALLHKTDDECVDFASLGARAPRANLELAFRVGDELFNIPRLLDPEDVCDVPKPDEKIVMAMLCFYFREFARWGRESAAARSIANA